MTDDERPLSEAAARRLLARAVELDARIGSELTVQDLRTAALEAGVDPKAFDQAVQELSAASSSDAQVPSLRRRVAVNLLAGGAFWLALAVLVRLARFAEVGWELRHAADILALAIGAAVAHRLGARLAQVIMVGLGGGLLAHWLIHLAWGIGSAQGGPTHFAVLGAGVIAAFAASALSAPKRPPAAQDAQTAASPAAGPPDAMDPPTHAYVRLPRPGVMWPSGATR